MTDDNSWIETAKKMTLDEAIVRIRQIQVPRITLTQDDSLYIAINLIITQARLAQKLQNDIADLQQIKMKYEIALKEEINK